MICMALLESATQQALPWISQSSFRSQSTSESRVDTSQVGGGQEMTCRDLAGDVTSCHSFVTATLSLDRHCVLDNARHVVDPNDRSDRPCRS
jgi:hypothetical protein